MKRFMIAGLCGLLCVSCASSQGGGTGGVVDSRDAPLSSQECDVVIRKGWDLKNVPIEAQMADPSFRDNYDKSVSDCAQKHTYVRKDLDCVARATTPEQYQACGRQADGSS